MKFIKVALTRHGSYFYEDASDDAMAILGFFLTSNVHCGRGSFMKWVFSDEEYTSGNSIALEKENGYVLLTDMYSEYKIPTVLKMKQEQFVHVLNEWQEKVCNLRPKEVIIKYENNQFVMETKD